MNDDNKTTHMRIYQRTQRNLRWLYAATGKSMIDIVDTLVAAARNKFSLNSGVLHTHKWVTRYIELLDNVTGASGMQCECGATLTQDEVEGIINGDDR